MYVIQLLGVTIIGYVCVCVFSPCGPGLRQEKHLHCQSRSLAQYHGRLLEDGVGAASGRRRHADSAGREGKGENKHSDM